MLFFKSIKVGNQYYRTWLLIFFLAALFAACDSCFVLFNPTRATFTGLGMSDFWAKVATSFLIAVYVICIDYALSIFYPQSINEMITATREKSRDTARWAITVLTFAFCVIQICITIGVSLELRHTSAAMMIETPVLTNVDSIVGVQSKAANRMATALSEQIDATKREKEQAISRSQNNRELQRLKNSGNGWAAQKLSSLAKESGASFNGSIKKLTGDYTTLLNKNADNLTIVATAAAAQNDLKAAIYKQRTASLANFFLYFAIAATLLQCFAGLMLGIYRGVYNYGNYRSMTETTGNYGNYQQDNSSYGNYQQDNSSYGNYQQDNPEKATSNYRNYQQDKDENGNYQQETDEKATSNYQVDATKIEYEGKYYEPGAIKRWAQNSDRRAAQTKDTDKAIYFRNQANELWQIWDKYEASQKVAA